MVTTMKIYNLLYHNIIIFGMVFIASTIAHTQGISEYERVEQIYTIHWESNEAISASVDCPNNKKAFGGGGALIPRDQSAPLAMINNRPCLDPIDTGCWLVTWVNHSSEPFTTQVRVMAICANVGIKKIGLFQQDNGPVGIVCMESENYHDNFIQDGHAWEENYTTGFSGSGAMIVLPDIGLNKSIDFITDSPQLDYKINFVKTGEHYIWIRGYGKNKGSDSIHSGLDGKATTNSANIKSFNPKKAWTWAGGVPKNVFIKSTGEHTINLWMREDGFIVDKIILTTNPGYIPSGLGLPESPTD